MKDLLKKLRLEQHDAIELEEAGPACLAAAALSLSSLPALVAVRPGGDPECSGWNSSATDPLHPNSSEINVRSGVAE